MLVRVLGHIRYLASFNSPRSVFVELGMMTGPPMGPMVGLFGYNYAWPQLFALTFVAHVVYGVALGLMMQHFLTESERGGLVTLLRGTTAKS